MANIAGVGLDARVCEMVNAAKKQGKRGKILYLSALIYNIIHRSSSLAKVVCDGKEIFTGAYLSMAFGIGKYSGGGMRQTPAAVIDDGLLDMTLIPEIAMSRILVEAPRLFTGSFLKVPELTSCRGKVLTVIPYGDNAAEPVEVDGEVVGKAPVRFEVRPDRINVVTGIQI
jgi:diacylglycerol kinase family enzyme